MSKARTRARRAAVQALYQWDMTGQDVREIEQHFQLEQDMSSVDLGYFSELVNEVSRHVGQLEARFSPFLDRPVSELDPVERAVLRLGTYELEFRLDVPYKVVINEAVELAKTFGAEQSHKYINSILDKTAQTLRAVEIAAKSGNQSARRPRA